MDEVSGLLDRTSGTGGLILRLLHGTGMRVMECLRLRVKDVNFVNREIAARKGKVSKDRVTMLPARRVASACGMATTPISSRLAPI
ncbi:MAG: tyrosine-type recombinase/integrase [Betaproteobacteria bacterium]